MRRIESFEYLVNKVFDSFFADLTVYEKFIHFKFGNDVIANTAEPEFKIQQVYRYYEILLKKMNVVNYEEYLKLIKIFTYEMSQIDLTKIGININKNHRNYDDLNSFIRNYIEFKNKELANIINDNNINEICFHLEEKFRELGVNFKDTCKLFEGFNKKSYNIFTATDFQHINSSKFVLFLLFESYYNSEGFKKLFKYSIRLKKGIFLIKMEEFNLDVSDESSDKIYIYNLSDYMNDHHEGDEVLRLLKDLESKVNLKVQFQYSVKIEKS